MSINDRFGGVEFGLHSLCIDHETVMGPFTTPRKRLAPDSPEIPPPVRIIADSPFVNSQSAALKQFQRVKAQSTKLELHLRALVWMT